MHLVDVVGEAVVEVLHVHLFLLPRRLDGRHAGRRHQSVIARVEGLYLAAAPPARRLARDVCLPPSVRSMRAERVMMRLCGACAGLELMTYRFVVAVRSTSVAILDFE